MDLVEQFMQGLELRDPAYENPRPLDFAVQSDRATLLVQANWWLADWGMDAGLIAVPAHLDPKTLRFVDLNTDVIVSTPSDGFWKAHLREARRRMDVDRDGYLDALLRLIEFEPDFDFGPWIEAVQARPPIDALAEIVAKSTALRPIGTIRLVDNDGGLIDALAIDELGGAATLLDDGWLGLFAQQWSRYAEDARPALTDYLGWLARQKPYGPFALERFDVSTEKGDLQALINRQLA